MAGAISLPWLLALGGGRGRRGINRRHLMLLMATGALGAGMALGDGEGGIDLTQAMLFGLI